MTKSTLVSISAILPALPSAFPKVAFAAKRFLAEKLDRKGDSRPCDVLLVGEYMQAAIGIQINAFTHNKWEEGPFQLS